MAAKGQGGFESDAGSKPGLECWRIENLNPVKQTDAAGALSGKLYEGDCYIFLHTKQKTTSLEWDLYFWLGKDCSQDEQGAAALRTVELDDQLGGGPVQYREVDNSESPGFLKLFPTGIQTMAGGVDSAFNKVDRDAYEPRLFHVTGKRAVKCTQCEMKSSAMNEGDCFILDEGKKIFQWNGKEANKYEKFKALEMVNKINADERGGKCELIFLESGKDDNKEFWDRVGPRSAVGPATPDVDAPKAVPKLVELSDSSGSLQTRVVAEGKLEYKDLNENEVFIVDTVQSLFVWIGGKASKEERRNGMKHGVQYASDNGYGVGCAIQVQKQGSETTIFKGYFKGWPDARKAKNSDDVSALYAAKAAQEEEMLGNMNGTIKNIWRIKDMKKEDLEKKFWGQFWAGDCFIILYSYPITPSKEGHIIYFWQGRDSSVDEKGASALLAKELDDEMGGDPVQCRVPMGKERKDFLSMFKGKMIVHEGGVASGFKNRADEDSFDTDGISLFHVRGSNEYNTRAVQVGEVAASLNSGDCFVLLTPNTMYVWKGKGSNAQEQKTAADIADTIKGNRSTTAVEEGSEPDEFWAAIGGKGEYPSSSQSDDEEVEPRLFLIQHMGSDGLRVEEVPNYDQSDLQNDDVMMLDVKSEVFLWIGAVSQREEKDAAMQVALDYVKNAPDGRDPDTPVYRISAGYEPPQFTQHFLGWDASKSSSMDEDPYLKLMAAMGKSTGGGLVAVSADTIGFAKPGAQSFTLAELQGPAPPGVDPARKEIYLSDADFQSLFGMDKDAWEKLPKWKREGAKKKNKLF